MLPSGSTGVAKMNRRWRIAAIAIGLALSPLTGRALAQNGKVAVFVESSTDDTLGRQLAFYIKEQIRRSGAFREAFQKSDSVFTIGFVTIDPDSEMTSRGTRTIYSYTIQLTNKGGLPYYITSIVGACGRQVLEGCSADLFASLGEQLEEIRSVLLKSTSQK